MRLTIAARRSALARIQAYQVGDALTRAHPHLTVSYHFRESLGDRNKNDPLWQMPEKGVFTEDLRADLIAGRCDLVVHSWKDLAIEQSPETKVAATLRRADARDVLLVRNDRWEDIRQSGNMRILTSSPRRAFNLDSFLRTTLPARLANLEFVAVRGNVPRRIGKMWQPGADGLVVAKAALDRLLEAERSEFESTRRNLGGALSQCRWMVLPLRANPAAPGQGALAIEAATERKDLQDLLAAVNCPETFACVMREREVLSAYGGGCHQKIGVSVLSRSYGEITFLRGITDRAQVLDGCMLRPSRLRPPKISAGQMWPADLSADLFTREELPAAPPDRPKALWIAKADAVPSKWNGFTSQIVWTSGVKTWQRLAQRGIWVNGTAESLGECEAPQIDTLIGAEADWLKLTHAGATANGDMPSLATYRLSPRKETIDLKGRKYFYWNSGSIFERALTFDPWLREMTHFCGPGNTQRILRQHGIEPHVFLDHARWLMEMSL